MKKTFFSIIIRSVSLFTILALIIGFLLKIFSIQAATLTTVRDRLSTNKANVSSGVDHYILFKPTTATADDGSSGGSAVIVRLTFPDADDTQWCRSAGAITVSGITSDAGESATALPGTLTANCTQGTGANSYDTIYICADNASLSTSNTYGVKLTGSTRLGTATSAADNIQISVATGIDSDGATNCNAVDTAKDNGTIAVSLITDDQVSVSATVNPSFTFSVSGNTLSFGVIPTNAIRYADTGTGSASEPATNSTTKITISTNAPNGAIVTARSANGGLVGPQIISAQAANAISAGNEGYGLYVKAIGSSLSAASGFGPGKANATLAISTFDQAIVTASGVVGTTNNTADIVLVAGIAATTQAGSYSDTIILTGVGRF